MFNQTNSTYCKNDKKVFIYNRWQDLHANKYFIIKVCRLGVNINVVMAETSSRKS